ncbi:MAG: DNA-processing protein DprA [Pseudomonadota bacterium]
MDHKNVSLSEAERLDWLRLYRSDRIGPIGFRDALRQYGDAATALKALPELAKRGGGRKAYRPYPLPAAQAEIQALDELGAGLLAFCEPDFPGPLAASKDAPPIISYIGHKHLFNKPAVAMVGARNASSNGRKFAESLARDLAEAELLVVSGLARGIDTAAHKGALSGGTAAVVGGGLDIVYPAENQGLYDQIVASGVILSEMPPGTRPQARHFPRRNRIISGMSLGVVVVEAAPKSGSLITANYAAEQGREVFAVPGSPLDPRARGCNQLIRQGATLIQSASDITDVLKGPLQQPLSEDSFTAYQPGQTALPSDSELKEGREILEELLSPTPVAVDELIRQCQLSPAVVSAILLELELAGRLERHPGNRVALIFNGNSP